MNNLEKKQERLKHLEEQYEKSKAKTEQLLREIKELTKTIEMESMADVFREGKVNHMTVSDWKKVRASISSGALQEFLKQYDNDKSNMREAEESKNEKTV